MTDTEIVFKIRAETDQLSLKLKKAEAEIKRLQKQMLKTKDVTKAVDQTTRSFATLATHIAKIVAIYATFEGLSTAVQAMGDFEQKMKEVGVVSGATADEFVSLTEKAKSLGESTQFSATQVAEAMKQMAMSGMKVNDIYVSIDDVLSLAAATMTDLGDSAQIVTTIMNTYHLQATDVNDVTDALAKTTTNSATTLEELGRAFAKVGPVANQLGTSVEETAAMLGVLADNGRRGAEAGTQLKIVMERLASNREAKKGLDAIGVSAYDATGKLKSMTQIMAEVKEGLKNLHNTAEANQIASVIFGEEAKSSAIALMDNLDKVDTKLKEIQLAMQNDFAGSAAKEMMDTLSGSWKKFKSALEGVALTIGENLIPALRDAIDDFTEFLGALDPEVLRGFGSALGDLAKSLEKAIEFVLDFTAKVITFAEDFPGATAAVGNFVGAVAALLTLKSVSSFLTGTLGPAVEYLGRTFTVIAGMVAAGGPLMIGLAALAAILGTLYTRQQLLNASFKDAERVMGKMSTQYGNVIDILQTVQDEVNKYGAAQKGTVEKAKKAIESLLPAYKKEIDALEKRYDLNEAQKEELNSLRSEYAQLQLRLEKLGKLKTFEKLAEGTKALSDGIQLTKEQLEEAQKVSDKFYDAYAAGIGKANSALDTLVQREISLKIKIGELAQNRVKIEENAAAARLDVNKSINDQIFNLYLSGMSKYDKLVAAGTHKEQTMREAEFNFEKALTNGRIDLAKKYAGEYANVISTLSEKEFFAIAQGEDRHKTFTQYKIELLNKARDLQIKAINAEEGAAKKATDEKLALAKKQLEAVEVQIKATKILISVMENLYDSFAHRHLFDADAAKSDIDKIKDMTADLNGDMKNLGIGIKTDAAILKAKEAGADISKIITEVGSKGEIKPKIDVNSVVDSMVSASKKAVVKTNEELDKVLFKLKFIPDKEKFDAKVQELIELTRKKKAGLPVEAELEDAEKALQHFVEEAEKDEITVDYNMKTLNEYIEESANKLGAFHPNVTPDVTFDEDAANTGVVSLIEQIEARGPAVDIPVELTSQDDFKQAVTDLLVLYKDKFLGIPVEPEKIDEAEEKVKKFVDEASAENITPGLDDSVIIEKVKSTAQWISQIDPKLTLYADDMMVKMAQENAERPLGSTLTVSVDSSRPQAARVKLSKPIKATNKIDADVKKPEVKRKELSKPIDATNKIDVDAAEPEDKREELSRPISSTLTVNVDDTEASFTLEELEKSVSTTLTVKPDTAEAEAKIKELKKPTSSNHRVRIDALKALNTIAEIKEPTSSYHYVRIDANHALDVIARLQRPTSSTHTIYVREVHLRAAGGSIYKRTGRVPGYDPTDSDKVPAMLTAGEFVVRRQAVDKYGAAFLNMVNSMQLPKFANGGEVSPGRIADPVQMRPIQLNIGGRSFQTMAATEVASALEQYLTAEGGL